MPITMSRRKQSNPKPLKSESDADEPMDNSSPTSPSSPDQRLDQPKTTSPPPAAKMDISTEAVDDQEKRMVEWPVKKGTVLGPFSARIEMVQEECLRENSICVRGSSKTLFSIFILEYYSEDFLNQTHIKPCNVNGSKAGLVYIYEPDKQLYLLMLKDVEAQEIIPTVFLEGGQDHHPGSDEVDDLIKREVIAAADAVRRVRGDGVETPTDGSTHASSDGPSPKSDREGSTSPCGVPSASVQEPMEVPSVSCQSCGVTFRNPSNLSAHQLYYCAARETTPVPPSTRSRPPRQANTPKEVHAANHAAVAKRNSEAEELVCILCKAQFSNLTNCLSHMVKLHTEHNSQACKCCNFSSADVKLLKEHMLIHVRGSGINPNVFMASQGSHGLMGPLAFHRMKDRRVEEKQKRKKHHQAPEGMSPSQTNNGSSTAINQDQNLSELNTKSTSKSKEQNGSLSPHGRNAEAAQSPMYADARRSPPTPSSDEIGHSPNELQTRPVGRFLCVECDIYFSSHKNYVAHKQFYCQGQAKDRKSTGHVQIPPVPSTSAPAAQCGSCGAVFPSRDKLAVHTLYFCQCRKVVTSLSQESSPFPERSNQHHLSSPKKDFIQRSSEEEKDKACSEKTNITPSSKPEIKVEVADEDTSANDKKDGLGKTGISPLTAPYQAGTSGLSPAPVLLAPGNVPTYIGRQGSSPVYIVASHVFVTPPGEPGTRAIPTAPYPQFPTVIPGDREAVFKSGHTMPISVERPLDLTVRKRKGCEEITSQGGSASKIIKNESDDKKNSSSPKPVTVAAPNIPKPFSLQNFPAQYVQYKCPGCQIAFNRIESLDIHRQFYCQSEGSGESRTPVIHTSTSHPVHTTLPALPYYQVVTNPNSSSGSALVPALATVNLKDNQSAVLETKGNEGSSSSKNSSISGVESTEGISTSHTTSPSHKQASQETNDTGKVEDADTVQQCSKMPQDISEMAGSPGPSPSTSRMSPNIPGSPKNPVRFPGGQSVDPGEHNGHSVPMYMPSVVRYMCPSCGVSFMKLESLSAHQQFYCRGPQEPLNAERGSPKAKNTKGMLLPNAIPRTVSFPPRSCSTSSESGSVLTRPTSSGGECRRKRDKDVAMETSDIHSGEGLQVPANGTVGPEAEKCVDSGNESRSSSSSEENGPHNSTYSDSHSKENGTEKDSLCVIKIKVEKEEGEENVVCNVPSGETCTVADNNNVTSVKLEKMDEDSCCSGSLKPVPKSCRQENGRPEPHSLHNSSCSPGPTNVGSDSGTRRAIDSTEFPHSPSSPSGGDTGSKNNSAGAVASNRPAPVMMKHCRACNISFSSLSTFIAHKKYYCASHHVTKSPIH